jgi:hypothetical protein
VNRKPAVQPDYSRFVINIFEEGHNVFYENLEDNFTSRELGPHPLTQIASQQREFLMSSMVITQFLDKVMSTYKNNCGVRISGNITEIKNQREMASTLGLEDEKAIGKLKKQFLIASVAGRDRPFLIKVPDVQKPLVAEGDLLARSKPFLNELQMKRQEIESRMFLDQVRRQDPNKIHLPELPEDAWRVLDYVFFNEFAYQKQIADNTGLSAHRLDDMKRLLLEKGLIRIEVFRVYQHNRAHYVLTPKTLEIFKTLGKNPQRIAYWRFISSVPGYYHRYMQFLFLGMHRRLGWKGSVERDLPNGRRVDVYVHRDEDGKRKAIEIETSTTDLLNKIRVLQDGYCDELVLLYRDVTGAQLARARLEKVEGIDGSAVWVGTINDYIQLLSEIIKAWESSGNVHKDDPDVPKTAENGKTSGNWVGSG